MHIKKNGFHLNSSLILRHFLCLIKKKQSANQKAWSWDSERTNLALVIMLPW